MIIRIIFLILFSGTLFWSYFSAEIIRSPSEIKDEKFSDRTNVDFSSKKFTADNSKLLSRSAGAELVFMRRLFEDYRINTINGQQKESTVQSYRPAIGVAICQKDGPEGIVKEKDGVKYGQIGARFSLNKLKPNERVTHAELHIFAPIKLRILQNKYYIKQIKLRSLGCFTSLDGAFEMRNTKWALNQMNNVGLEKYRHAEGKWINYDAKEIVEQSLLETKGQSEGELFIQFLHHDSPMSLSRLRRHLRIHHPFLVVYSEFTEKSAGQDISSQASKSESIGRVKREIRATYTQWREKKSTLEGIGKNDGDGQDPNDVKKVAEYYAYGMAPSSSKTYEQGIRSRSGKANFDVFRHKGPKILHSRRQRKEQRRSKFSSHRRLYDHLDNDPMLGFGREPWNGRRDVGRQFNSPNSGNTLNDLRALHEHGYRTLEPKEKVKSGGENRVEMETQVVLLQTSEDDNGRGKEQKCMRQNFTINFRDIGWEQRIIAPKSFDAGYCAGACDPLEDPSASNRAILQALLAKSVPQIFSTNAEIPSLICCAPDQMDSLTLLYFDESDNVVLKNFPRMTVKTCGCQ